MPNSNVNYDNTKFNIGMAAFGRSAMIGLR